MGWEFGWVGPSLVFSACEAWGRGGWGSGRRKLAREAWAGGMGEPGREGEEYIGYEDG